MQTASNRKSLNVCVLTYLDVAAGRDQKRVVRGEVQVGHPAPVERVHTVFTLPGANLQQRPVLDVPELRWTDKHYKPHTKWMSPINKGVTLGLFNTQDPTYRLKKMHV